MDTVTLKPAAARKELLKKGLEMPRDPHEAIAAFIA